MHQAGRCKMQLKPIASGTKLIVAKSPWCGLSFRKGLWEMVELDAKSSVLLQSFPNKGKVYVMVGLDDSSPDYNDLLSIAFCFARKGHTVVILKPTHYKDPLYHDVYGSLIGTRYYRKCPDLLVDGDFYEYESYKRPFEMGKIERMLSRGAKQSSNIVIDVRGTNVTKKTINSKIQHLKEQVSNKGDIESVWLYDGEGLERVYKEK